MKKYVLFLLGSLMLQGAARAQTADRAFREAGDNARLYWCQTAYRIAHPVLDALSRGELRATMPTEQHPGSGREKVTHLEAFGRTLCGIAPWIESGGSIGEEGKLRTEITRLALEALKNIADPASADFLPFYDENDPQPLVDAAFLAQGLMRAPDVLWNGLDSLTQRRLLDQLVASRQTRPWNNNWLLFSAMIETFFLSIGEPYDIMRIDYAVRQHEAWYKGDGAYGDGASFHWDYYNSFVIQPMMVDIVRTLKEKQLLQASRYPEGEGYYDRVLGRSTRYAAILERMIAPDGTYPPLGRSLAYRIGVFHSLGQMALLHSLPENVSPAQVRCALTAVIERQMDYPGTFDRQGWLTLGFCGHQPSIAEFYVSTGSLYLCTTGLLALGLPASDPFWSAAPEPWTQAQLWRGEDMPRDEHLGF